MFSTIVITLLAAVAPYLPSPHDKGGLGVRIWLERAGPLLQCERLDQLAFHTILINHSREVREHDPLIVAHQTGDLRFQIAGPDGKLLGAIGGDYNIRDPFTVKIKLGPGESFSDRFGFGHGALVQTGRYQAIATLKIDGTELTSPPFAFEVVKVPDEAVVVSHNMPRVGAKPPPGEKQERAAVEQIWMRERVWLVYRRWGGFSGLIFARRLAILPEKCEMSVEGAYATGNPITIKYRDANSKTGWTTLVINSINGLPWTDEEERLRIERSREEQLRNERAKPPLPQLSPAPRPVKP